MRSYPDLAFDIEEALFTTLRSNTTLVTGQLGGNAQAIRQTMDNQARLVPSIGIRRIADDLTELEMPVLVQFDWFGISLAQTRELRRQTLLLVSGDYTFTLAGIELWSRYLGTRREDDPEPLVSHLSGDVEFHPYREYT
jgi:hypothetical protein